MNFIAKQKKKKRLNKWKISKNLTRLLYTYEAAEDKHFENLGGRRNIKKKNKLSKYPHNKPLLTYKKWIETQTVTQNMRY
ncbi:hypothetical protein PR242_03145, partial [Metamycoplasma hyosynoviae]|uniref:hypothetical protein n=1 Tax=Metamycoplasma hyosynoviae TaxID=29559 RepID=UPI002359DE8C